jgi:DNA-binding transcriptional LysR family regulator
MAIVTDPRVLGAFSSLELRHLAALDAVATEGTFGRAARRLGYTQSAVSQQIAALEKSVGGTVFDRPGGPRPVSITPLGKVVLAHARDLLAKAQAAAESIERFKAGEAGRVDIGTFQSVSSMLLPEIVTQLRAEHPAVDVRLFEEEAALPKLHAGEVDVVFWVGPLDADLERTKLLDDPYVLVARRGDFPDGPVALEQLDGEQIVSWPLICDQDRVDRTLAARGVQPVVVFRTADNGTLLSMVRAGLGPAVMAQLAVEVAADDPDLVIHSLHPPIPPREIAVFWQAGRTLSPLAQRVIEIAVEVATHVAHRTRPDRVA